MSYEPTIWRTGDTVTAEKLNKIEQAIVADNTAIEGKVGRDEFDTEIATLESKVGSPLIASTVSEMTETDRVYVYTGSETGYTSGNWYYYDGTAWTSGGVYNAVAIETDTTLSVSGKAADAKKVGDELADVKEDLNIFRPTATAEDVGKALIVKSVADGVPTEFEYGEAGGGSGDTDKTLTESDIPADADVTGRYIRAILNLLKGATYDQSKVANAEHVIDMLDIEIQGIYTLSAPLVCDADQFIDTGFSVASAEDYGYANDWYILLDAKLDAVSKILGNSVWWFERQSSGANNSMLVVRQTYNFEGKIGGQVLGNRFKYVIAYDHTTHRITAHGVNNNTLISVTPDVNVPSAWGPLMVGGSTAESFKGTIYQLDVRLGTLTESEIKAYLGVE